jgi:hypothetical protein
MPERWEREVRKLRGVEANEHLIRERAGRGPSPDRRPSRRNALVAGFVAGAVAIAGIAFLGQLDGDSREIAGPDNLPSLLVTFEMNGFITEQSDEQIQRVDTTIVYGEAREESFTSTVSEGAQIDWVGADDLTRFVPGPTVGSQVRFDADGENARVLIGEPGDWPEFERFSSIETLPSEPGEYVLVFEADYPDGVARTARLVHVVAPGVLQLDITEGKALDAATAAVYVDGRRTDGFLSTSSFWQSDVGAQSPQRAPSFGPDAWLPLPSATPMIIASAVNEARAGLYPSYGDFEPNRRLPIDLVEGAGVIDGRGGRLLLTVEATWKHGKIGWAHNGTEERATFFFPIEIVTEEPTPVPERSPSPSPAPSEGVTIDITRSSAETGGPEATARLGDQEVWMCPDGWTVVNPDGTEESVVFDCGQSDVFSAPVGTPIDVTGDFATVNVTTRVSGDRVPGSSDAVPVLDAGSILTLGYEVTWDDGSHASFWLLLTVQGDAAPSDPDPEILVRIYGLGERSTEVPVITMTYGGETQRGCTEAFEWTLPDGTRVDEASGRHGSILPQCSYEPIFAVPPGVPITLEVPTATEVFATRTMTPFYEGRDGFGASVRWPGDGEGDFTVTFEVVGSPSDRDIELDCAEEDRIAFTTPDGPRILPGGSAYIVGNMAGFQQTDVVEQMTREPGGSTEWDGTWQVVRDGSVIAAVEFGSLRGTACRGTGIGGV